MAKFRYKAKKGVDQVIEGFIDAQNNDDALNKLAAQGIFAISIQEDRLAAAGQKSDRPVRPSGFGKKVTPNDLLLFSRNILTLLHAKVELLSAIKIIYEQTDNTRLKDIMLSIYEETRQGKTFSETLEMYPEVFSPLFVNLIKAGEATGRLDYSFEQITEYLLREQALRTKIKVALAYPTLLLFVGLASIFVLITFVVPKLKPIFAGSYKDLPMLTKIILALSDFSHNSWFWWAGLAIILLAVVYARKGAAQYKSIIRKIGMKIPLVKRLISNKEIVNFTRALSSLLKSGVMALKSIEISSRILENPKLKEELEKVHTEVASGQSLAKSMEAYTGLPKFFTRMIAVGEESGRLGDVLDEISRSYDQQVETDIMLISALIEPLLILVLGLILGTIVLSILLPTFQMTQMVR
jgi:type II secretory pathway component PulF